MKDKKSEKSALGQKHKTSKRNGFPANGKLFYKITLKLTSPLIIGCGEDERSDVDVMRDPVNGHPMIPATSLIGVFSHYLEKNLEMELNTDRKLKTNYHFLFGYREFLKESVKKKNETEPAQYQSALQCNDVILIKNDDRDRNDIIKPVLRDGVKIDPVTGAAEDQSKYNYEIVEGSHEFCIDLEITIRKNFDKELFKKLLNTLFIGIEKGNIRPEEKTSEESVKNGYIRLGAKTNKGFGRIQLLKVELADLNFDRKPDVYQWLSGKYNFSVLDDLRALPYFEIENRRFTIDAWFKIRNSFLIKEYADESGDVDARHIEQNGQLVLPGTSVMGAIQHQSRKILHTILNDLEKVSAKMDELFGFVKKDEPDEAKKAGKGHILIEETIIDRGKLAKEVQTRIKVDRFTGGVVSGALFKFEPLWQKGNHKAVQIKIVFNGSSKLAWAPGLLILLLKDLWYGDLPVGGEKNIGRGSLQGVSAEIFKGNEKIAILNPDESGGIAEADTFINLQKYITKLWEELGNGKK